MSWAIQHPETTRQRTIKSHSRRRRLPAHGERTAKFSSRFFFSLAFPIFEATSDEEVYGAREEKKKSSVAILHSENLLVCDKTWHFRVSDDLGCRAFFVSFSQQCVARHRNRSHQKMLNIISSMGIIKYREIYICIYTTTLLRYNTQNFDLTLAASLSSLLCALKSIELSISTTRQHRSSIELIQARMSI